MWVRCLAPRGGAGGSDMKSETRKPKAEGNPKIETRINRRSVRAADRRSQATSEFGFRASFGFRVSALGFRRVPTALRQTTKPARPRRGVAFGGVWRYLQGSLNGSKNPSDAVIEALCPDRKSTRLNSSHANIS